MNKKNMNKKILSMVILGITLALLVTSCGGSDTQVVEVRTGVETDGLIDNSVSGDTQAIPSEVASNPSQDEPLDIPEVPEEIRNQEILRVKIVIDDGDIQVAPPPSRPDFAFNLDDRIGIHVTSDISDEVHIHGYDRLLYINDNQGVPEEMTFWLGIPGQFEVELEKSHRELFTFTVQ